jgi:hypothetical protein
MTDSFLLACNALTNNKDILHCALLSDNHHTWR